jgi:hypothetical protein
MKKNILILVPISLLLLVTFNNCSGEFSASRDIASTSQASQQSSDSLSQASTSSLPFALLSVDQTLSSMLNVTNNAAPSTAILNEYNNRYGALAAGNDLGMVNSPLLLSTTSLAGEVCNSLVQNEKNMMASARSFFPNINFAAGINSVDSASYELSIRALARSAWGRNETQAELDTFTQFKTDFTSALATSAQSQSSSTSSLITATCAAVLSSFDAITY